jgi:hypothetical protein
MAADERSSSRQERFANISCDGRFQEESGSGAGEGVTMGFERAAKSLVAPTSVEMTISLGA